MKNILFTLTKDFVLIPCEANKVYELENNVSKLIIKTPNVLDGFVYKLHKEQFNSKSFVVLNKTAEGLELLLDNGFLNKNGIYRVQLSANSDDKQIISNSVQLTVGRFINATEEPTPEQETAIDRLLVKAEVLAEAAADLNTLAVRTIANGIAVDYKGETFEVHNGNDGKDGENGKDGEQGPKGEDGAQGPVGPAGVPGVPGFSPSARVYRVSDGAVIEVTDEHGTTSAKVSDGKGSEGGASYYKLTYEDGSLINEVGGRVYSSDVVRAFNSGMVPVVNYEGLELSYFGLKDYGEVCAFGCVILGDSMVPVIITLTVDYAGDVLTNNVTVLTEEAVSGLRTRVRNLETELTQTNEALSELKDTEIPTIKADLNELEQNTPRLENLPPPNILNADEFEHGKSLSTTVYVATPNDLVDSPSTTVINTFETEGDEYFETNLPSGSIILGYRWYNNDYRREQFISSFETEGDHFKFKMLAGIQRVRGWVYNNRVSDFRELKITKYGDWDKQGGNILKPNSIVGLDTLNDKLRAIITPTTLANKKICGVGDSIMIGVGDGAGGFLDVMKDYEDNVTVVNLGVGSTTIQFNDSVPANISGKCILDRLDDIPEDTDIIILEGGLNDYYHQEQYGTTLGTYEEYLHQYPLSARYENGAYVNLPYVGQSGVLLNNNFCNAFEMCLTKVLVRFIGKPFIYVIPHNPVGSADIDLYFDTAKTLCKKYGVPCLDMREVGCMPRINILCGREGHSKFTVDAVHPNKLGYKTHYAPLIYNFLKSIIV